MEMNRNQSILLGVFTFLPFILFPIILFQVFGFVMNMVAANEYGGEPEASEVIMGISSFIVPIIIAGLLSLGLTIFYIIHAAMNKKLESIEQVMWILLFIFFGIIVFPIYWFIRIWNTSKNP
jgi:hypothetical protein